MFVGLQRWK